MGTILEEIPYQDIHFNEVVGRGSFGVVYRAQWKGQTVAVKRAETETEVQSFRIEVRQLQRVCHPNIITIYGVCLGETSPLCLVMEFAECGSLYQFLHGTENSPQYSLAHAISWLSQCAKGVAYLHGMKPKAIIHRDLKPPNILLTDAGTKCKICDFGTACEAQTYLTNNRGSAAWMAPEMFEGNKYSEKCDVFSFGIIIWEILTRRRPYDDIGNNIYRIMWSIHRGIRPPQIRGCPPVLETLMQRCWAKNTLDRPSMRKCVRVLARFLLKLRGAMKPISSWKQSSQNLSRIRTTDNETADSLRDPHTFDAPASAAIDTVLVRAKEYEPPTHTNTINILPLVEAEAEPSVRYTTLHEYPREINFDEDEDSYAPRFSSTFAFPTVNDDHGFVEHNLISADRRTTQEPRPRPATLNLGTQSSGNFQFSYPNANIHIEYSGPATRTVRRVHTYSFGTPGSSTNLPSGVRMVTHRMMSDPGSPDLEETDDSDSSKKSYSLFAR